MFKPRILTTAVLTGGVIASLIGCGGGSGDGSRFVFGGSQVVSGATVSAWSRLASNNTVLEVGATIPLSIFQNPPAQAGAGPAGAIAVVDFPAQAQSTTFFNHLELHWNPTGHPPAYTMVPHFDLHFYGVSKADVLQVASPDPADPADDHVPTGYAYPPASDVVPEMGRHAHNPADYTGTFTTKVNVVGFYNGQLTFLEPTITQTYLTQKANFTLAVPRPAVLGRSTLYPSVLTATYLPSTDSYSFVYSGFVAAQ